MDGIAHKREAMGLGLVKSSYRSFQVSGREAKETKRRKKLTALIIVACRFYCQRTYF
jgi:hypothetical protein